MALSHVTAYVFVLLAYCFESIECGKMSHVFLTLIHRLLIPGYYEEVLAATRHKHATCWIVTQSIEDRRARTLASTHTCQLITNPSQYTDYTLLQAAPRTLIMGVSTFIYFPAFLGAASEVVKGRRGGWSTNVDLCACCQLELCLLQFILSSALPSVFFC